MEVKAKISYLRIAPRKVRLVVDLIRGKNVERAKNVLNFTTKKASLPLIKLLNQALANAKNNFQLDPANLYVSKIFVDEGPKYKRWQARSRGQAYEIQKKTSHVTIILDEMKKTAKKPKRAKAKISPGEKVEKKPSIAKAEEIKEEKIVKSEQPKFRPEKEFTKPKKEGVFKRVFRRKAIG